MMNSIHGIESSLSKDDKPGDRTSSVFNVSR